jgi:hypothetical protein
MPITIEVPQGEAALTEFIQFADRINSKRSAWWPSVVPMSMPLLNGDGPDAKGRHVQPFVARDDGEIVARVLAIVDDNYLARWQDDVGHTSMFEALPGTREAVRELMDAACGWLRERGMRAARAGFGQSDFPFLIDGDDTLPPTMLRANPGYYHTLLKEAGFESEKGWVDYRIEVTSELIARWESAVKACELSGFRLVRYKDVPARVRTEHFVSTWNEGFSDHWGVAPLSVESHEEMSGFLSGFGMGDTSVIAYEGDEPVGIVWVVPELASGLASRDRELRGEEKVNFLGIAVRTRARGKGVNMAMAATSYLELVRRGATHVSYTLVLDDNCGRRVAPPRSSARPSARTTWSTGGTSTGVRPSPTAGSASRRRGRRNALSSRARSSERAPSSAGSR